MKRLQDELGLSYLFITHDLGVVRSIAHRVAVMYLGRIAEIGDVASIFARPRHPYTAALLSASPIPDPTVSWRHRRLILKGDVPSPANPPGGCRFHPRCPAAMPLCGVVVPERREVAPGHFAACHLNDPAIVPSPFPERMQP
jgi:oligopeptide/dipeptide ABC transporter ATP-binding protein